MKDPRGWLGGAMAVAVLALLGGWATVLLARSRRPPPPLPPYEIPTVSPDEPLPGPPQVPLAQRQVLRFNNGAEPQTLDPAKMTGVPAHTIALALFEGLASLHPKTLRPVPGVARRWESREGGRVYRFHLREARWSNGQPLVAADFVYAWRRVLEPETASEYAYMLYCIENAEGIHKGQIDDARSLGVEALDERTLEVRLEHPVPYFAELVAFATYAPVNRQCVEDHGDDWTLPRHMVCNGPFALAEWSLQERIVLRRNPRYWNAERVVLETIHALAIDDAETARKKYLNGEVDWIREVPAPMVADAARLDGFRYAPSLGTYFYRFNVTRPPLDDRRVRLALNLAVDKRAIARYLLRAGQRAARSFVPPILPGYAPVEGPDYDPDRARRLLAEAGFPGGQGFPELELLYNSSEAHKQIAEAIQYIWRTELGVHITLRNQEWKVYLDSMNQLDYDVARSAWIGDYADPNTFLDCFVTGGGNNRTGWSSREYDRLIRQAARESDPQARMRLLQDAERILVARELPIMPIYFYVYAYLVRPKVLGVYDNPRNVHPFQYMAIAAE
ncbi:MAG: peptide ABC transporter substrate-binding protein [Candidatus Brocadiia bacterium]